MGFWQDFEVKPDPWALEYELPIALEDSQATKPARTDIEGVAWGAIAPERSWHELPPTLAFIDGRRRLDGRAIGKDGDRLLYGAFATVAAGCIEVDCQQQRAHFPADATVERVVAFGGGHAPEPVTLPGPPGNSHALEYGQTLTEKRNDPQVPVGLVQNRMRAIEAELAVARSREAETLVVLDGNLLPACHTKEAGPIVGYMKTLQKKYLPPEEAQLLWQLRPGERTPLFSIGRDRLQYWSWYLRSGKHGGGSLHGIVRLEMFADKVELEMARKIADWSCHLVPKYASEPLRDPRAPQNLMPVNALEQWLGRHMGNPAIVQRCVKQFLQGVQFA